MKIMKLFFIFAFCISTLLQLIANCSEHFQAEASSINSLETKGRETLKEDSSFTNKSTKEDESSVEIYYFAHPKCMIAEYKGDIHEVSLQTPNGHLWSDDATNYLSNAKEKFIKEIKERATKKFNADIICGANLDLSYMYDDAYDHGYDAMTMMTYTSMIFTGT